MVDVRRQIKRIVRNAAKDYGLGWRVPQAYRSAVSAPVDERKVLFVESSLAALPDAFKVIYARFDEDQRFDATFVSLGKHRVSAAEYLRKCEAFAREAATARIVFLCDASDVVSCLPLRPETKVVQLWHACGAFKRFGMSTATASYGLSRADIRRHPFYGNLSLVTVSSPEVEWAYAEAMDLEGEGVIAPIGVSRTDLFFDESFHEQAIRHLFDVVPQAVGKRVVLYAPTYRGDLSCARAPKPPDFSTLKGTLGRDSIMLVKQHPMVDDVPSIPDDCADFAFEVSEAMPIDELLVVSDVLVTDYSSVVFEFSLFNRPMVFYAPDLDDYIADRDFYYDFDSMTPGPVVATSDELAACLARCGVAGEEVRVFRDYFMSACDGHATDRIFEYAVAESRADGLAGVRHALSHRPVWRRWYVTVSQALLNGWYRLCRRDGRLDEAVFISRQADEPSYDFLALARQFESRGWVAAMHLKKVTRRNMASYLSHVITEVRLLGRCKVVIVDRYDPVVSLIDFDKGGHARKSGPINVSYPRNPLVFQLWHAFGSYKRFGYQSVDTPEGHPSDYLADWRIHRNYSWVACSGQGARAAFAQAFSCDPDRVVALNRPEFDELVAMRRAMYGGEADRPERVSRPVVLMAPTLRKSSGVAHPFRDLHRARQAFEGAIDARVVWAFHPLEEKLPASGNVSDELVSCSIVVTDYSSIVYEAYLLDKPVLFYIPDIDDYLKAPGLNFNPAELASELCCFTEEELSCALSRFLADPEAYPYDALERFAGKAFDWSRSQLDGADLPSSASAIVDFLIEQAR